jgi:hypothetical protein
MKNRAKLQRGLYQLGKIAVATNGDIIRSLERFHVACSTLSEGESHYWRAQFWHKSVIRSFFAMVEATSFAMRKAVIEAADEAGVELTNKERAKLMERKYDTQSDTITDIDVKGGKVAENLKLVFKYFPRLFGVDFKPDFGQVWQTFLKLIDARNEMTHSGMLEHIIPIATLPLVQPSVMWFLATLRNLLSACGLDKKDLPRQGTFMQTVSLPPMPGFDANFYQMIGENESMSLEYLRMVLSVLHRELEVAMQEIRELPVPTFLQKVGQFTFRNLLRTLFAQVEATTCVVNWYIEEQEKREDIEQGVGLESHSQVRHGGRIADKFVKAMERFSLIDGFDYRVKMSGAGWSSFLLAETFRDRITHPKSVDDMRFNLNAFERLPEAAYWFYSESSEALDPSEKKWTERQAKRVAKAAVPT